MTIADLIRKELAHGESAYRQGIMLQDAQLMDHGFTILKATLNTVLHIIDEAERKEAATKMQRVH